MLDYATPRPTARLANAASAARSWGLFFLGILIGLGVEAVFAMAVVNTRAGAGGVLVAVASPMVAGFAISSRPRLRGLGVGLLVSPALAFLIFVGLCFAALSRI